jgi:SAM-dependent methyltransferase
MGNEKLKKGFDLESQTYDKDRNQTYFTENVRVLEDLLEGRSGKILEVGCGTGMYIKELRTRGHDMVGVDYSKKMCTLARMNLSEFGDPTELIKHRDAEESLGFDVFFNMIVIMDCWEFFPNPDRVIKNAYNAMETDGLLVIITVNPWFAPAIVLCEYLKIKKNRPAFHYYNSFRHRTINLVRGFSLVKHIKSHWGMKYIYVFRKEREHF